MGARYQWISAGSFHPTVRLRRGLRRRAFRRDRVPGRNPRPWIFRAIAALAVGSIIPVAQAQTSSNAVGTGSSASPAVEVSLPVLISTASFRGEGCQGCHGAIRDRSPQALSPETSPRDGGTYDVVIVGGGLAGLTAGYYLREYRSLVLEKESRIGGKMRRESFHGRLYPVGGIYTGEPEGKIRGMFRALGIKPQRVVLSDHSMMLMDGTVVHRWISGDAARLPYSGPAQARIAKFQEAMRRWVSEDKLSLPIEECDPQALAELDRFSFYQWVDNRFGSEAAELADLYCRDVFGIGARDISAVAGLMFMSSELAPSYTWEGGLGVISESLGEALPHISTGMFVWRVSQDLDGATVEFHDGKKDWRVHARAVVLAVPAMVARRIAVGWSEEKQEALSKVRYSSYAIVPLRFKRVLWKEALILWTPGRYFADLTLPLPSAQSLKGASDQILLASIPMDESGGRKVLLEASDSELTAKVLEDLDTVFAGASSEVVEARVLRWGHAMPIPYPGYLTAVRPILAKPEGRFFLAGVDTQLPALEGAFYSGLRAADAVRRFLKTQRVGP